MLKGQSGIICTFERKFLIKSMDIQKTCDKKVQLIYCAIRALICQRSGFTQKTHVSEEIMAKGKQKANFSSLAEMFPRKGQHKKTMSKDLTNRFTQENAHDAIELHSHTHEKHTHTQAHTHRDTQTQTHRHAHSHTHKHTSTHTKNTHTHTHKHTPRGATDHHQSPDRARMRRRRANRRT